MGGGAIAAPPPIPGSSQMKMQFVPASHGQNTLGTDVPRIIRHDGAKNRVGRVPGTRTGAADLDYEGNVYTEKRVMWETLSPGFYIQNSKVIRQIKKFHLYPHFVPLCIALYWYKECKILNVNCEPRSKI